MPARTRVFLGPAVWLGAMAGCGGNVDPIVVGTPYPGSGPTVCDLQTNGTGRLKAGNPCGIQGAWYTYRDCDASADCSQILEPAPGQALVPSGDRLCTAGATALASDRNHWGAGIGVTLNQPVERNPLSIGTLGVVLKGFRFEVINASTEPVVGRATELRVNFPVVQNGEQRPFCKVIAMTDTSPVMFTDIQPYGGCQSSGDEAVSSVPFDSQKVIAIEFGAIAEPNVEISYDFCIRQLEALYVPAP